MASANLIVLSAAFALTAGLTPLVGWLARRWGAIDDPNADPGRKRHARPIPLLGGLAIIASVNLVWWWFLVHQGWAPDLPLRQMASLAVASLLIAVGGALDDRFNLPPRAQLLWAIGAVVVTVAAGVGVRFITNPLGGVLYLDRVSWTLFSWHGAAYHLTWWADLFTFVWLLGAMYTTKILDGLDGLVSGLGVIGSLIVFLLTLRPEVNQPGVALMALTLAGAGLGFLVWNWHPARIFLGESGSLFIGFSLGVLSIISGGKIATALLILGLPILDLLWVIVQRLRRRTSPFATADRLHLHFRLLDADLSVRQCVLLLYGVVAVFGLSTLYARGPWKLVALGGIFAVMLLLVWWIIRRTARHSGGQRRP